MTAPTYRWQPTTRIIAARTGLAEADVVRFDQNTLSTTPSWIDEVLDDAGLSYNEYPQSDYYRLRQAIGHYTGADTEGVLVGAGADDLIGVCAAALLEPGSTALGAEPTYSLYRVATTQRRAVYESIPRRAPGWALDVEQLIARSAGADLIWLCVPSNPTGNRDSDADLNALLDGVSIPVVVDAAYAEFASDSWWPWIERYDHLVALGTFSKAHGLAATRVGYALASPDLAGRLNTFRPPGSVSDASAVLATYAAENPAHADDAVVSVARDRELLHKALEELGWTMNPTVTNFVLGRPNIAAAPLKEALMWEDGLVVRGYGDGPLASSLRITVRSPEENARLLRAIERRTT